MHKLKHPRTTPKIPGSKVYGHDELSPALGNSVYKHRGRYHVFVGVNKVMMTEDLNAALLEAAKPLA